VLAIVFCKIDLRSIENAEINPSTKNWKTPEDRLQVSSHQWSARLNHRRRRRFWGSSQGERPSIIEKRPCYHQLLQPVAHPQYFGLLLNQFCQCL